LQTNTKNYVILYFSVKPVVKEDIRKTLHELHFPRRNSPGPKSLPIRARHPANVFSANSNQPMGSADTLSQPIPSQGQPVQKSMNEGLPMHLKLFSGKKMWRAPSGQPENATTRPFSPFGGTLPPAKIKEQEKRRHHTDDSD